MTSTKRSHAVSAAAFLAALTWINPASGAEPFDACPKLSTPTIEVLNFVDKGSTLGFVDRVRSYSSNVCSLPRISFPGPEAVYKVILHNPPGNLVGFELRFPETCQLLMALVKACGSGNSCLRNSPGNLRGGVETIKPYSYPEGTYYLYIDSLSVNACPSYTLSVTGINPVPDLKLDLKAQTSVVAGDEMTYTLTTGNIGSLDATGVQMILTLPPGVTYRRASDKCMPKGNQVFCKIEHIGVRESPPPSRTVTVAVDPSVRNPFAAQAVATANEGDPTSPNEASVRTQVQAKSDLSITNTSVATSVAGLSTTYTLTLQNNGPSDATKVVVNDTLPSDLPSASGSGCEMQGSQLVCKVDRIKAHSSIPLSITAGVKPSAEGAISHDVKIAAAERDPFPGINNTTTVRTKAIRQTDLSIVMTGLSPARRAAGERVLYQFQVENKGPSNSKGASVTNILSTDLMIDSENCLKTAPYTVTCTIDPLKNGEKSEPVSFEAIISPASDPQTLTNTATVLAKDQDLGTKNNALTVATDVVIEADMLAQLQSVERIPWRLGAAPGNVKAGENLLYTVRIANDGPSDFRGGSLQDDLTEVGLDFVSSPDGCSSTDDKIINCPVPGRKKGEEDIVRRFVVRIPPSRAKKIDNRICIKSNTAEHDSNKDNDCADTSTSPEKEADLSVTLSDSPDAVLPGGEGGDLTYTLKVKNEGPSDAAGVTVDLFHPPADAAESRTEFDDVAVGATESHSITVSAPGERGKVVRTAKVQSDMADLNHTNDSAEATTTVATSDDADLILTKTAGAEAAVAGRLLSYTLALANQGFHRTGEAALTVEDPLDDAASFEPSQSSAECTDTGGTVNCTFPPLDPGQSETRTLTVHVEPTGSLSNTANVLQADAEAVHDPNPDNNQASAEVPVVQTSTDTELCASWSVRFLRGQPAGTSTDLLFFVPGNPGGAVATGRVFTESGAFVQNVSVESSEKSFRRSIDAQDDGGLPLLAGSGSIEWTFSKGLVGNVTAIHKRAGDEVALPSFCRSGHTGAHSLILPFFQVDSVLNTHVAVRNETDDEVQLQVTYSDASGEPKQQPPRFPLAGHGTWTANLRGKDLGIPKGFVEMQAFGTASETVDALSGDFIRVGGPGALAGSALVENPAGLCQTWNVNFDQGTQFLVYIQGEGNLELTAHDEAGNPLSVTPPNTNDRSFLVSASDLGLIGKGSVEWNLGVPGFVATLLFSNGSGSVLIPGTCR